MRESARDGLATVRFHSLKMENPRGANSGKRSISPGVRTSLLYADELTLNAKTLPARTSGLVVCLLDARPRAAATLRTHFANSFFVRCGPESFRSARVQLRRKKICGLQVFSREGVAEFSLRARRNRASSGQLRTRAILLVPKKLWANESRMTD